MNCPNNSKLKYYGYATFNNKFEYFSLAIFYDNTIGNTNELINDFLNITLPDVSDLSLDLNNDEEIIYKVNMDITRTKISLNVRYSSNNVNKPIYNISNVDISHFTRSCLEK